MGRNSEYQLDAPVLKLHVYGNPPREQGENDLDFHLAHAAGYHFPRKNTNGQLQNWRVELIFRKLFGADRRQPIDLEFVDHFFDSGQALKRFLSHLFLEERADATVQNHDPRLFLTKYLVPR